MNPIQQLIINYQTREAFWAAAENVEQDHQRQDYFLRILRARNNVALLFEDLDKIQRMADNGNPYMQYALARLHDCLQFRSNSNDEKLHYYSSAYLLGHIADARAFLALAYRDGDFGEADVTLYRRLIEKSAAEGSEKARQQEIRDAIYGQFGKEENVSAAYDTLEQIIEKARRGKHDIDPQFISLLADADLRMGRVSNALDNYEKAARLGCSAAYFWSAFYGCCDEHGFVEDREGFIKVMERAREVFASEGFLEYAMLVDEDLFDSLSDEDMTEIHKALDEDLQYACMLGESIGALYLGGYYEGGNYGFPQDYTEAWHWYSAGANLRDSACYAALARMVLDDHTAPKEYDEAYAYECAYKSLLLGGDTLATVVQGYRNGFLTSHAAAIEQTYLPRYEQEMTEQLERMQDLEDNYNDDHEYLGDAD